MKAGKSTLVNAIIGKNILPSRINPMTVIPTRIINDSSLRNDEIKFKFNKFKEFNKLIKDIKIKISQFDKESGSKFEEKIKETTPKNKDILEIIKIFKAYNFTNFKFDPSVIRGLEYYTGLIFEVNLTFDVKNSKGQVIQFGSIGGGGRYDNLVRNFGNLDFPATGISIGIDRLVYALMQKKEFNIKSNKPVVICVFDKNSIVEYVKLQNKLRLAKISVEIYSGDGNLKTQMKYADKLGSPAVIFYGENEIKSRKVTLKNLKSGQEISVEMESLVDEIKKLL